jgi:hypothetical protein
LPNTLDSTEQEMPIPKQYHRESLGNLTVLASIEEMRYMAMQLQPVP